MIWYLVIYWSLATATLDPSIVYIGSATMQMAYSPTLVNVCPEGYRVFRTTSAEEFNFKWTGMSEQEKGSAMVFKGPEYSVTNNLILKRKP